MSKNKVDIDLIRWFYRLPVEVRYRFSSKWMKDEAASISNPKLAECLVGEKTHSEGLVKGFRSYDLKNNKFKKVWRPDSGYSDDDVHLICHGINAYRAKNGRDDKVNVEDFYLRAWHEFSNQYPLDKEEFSGGLKVDSHSDVQSRPKLNIDLKTVVLLLLLFVLLFWFVEQNNSEEQNEYNAKYLPGNVVQYRQLDDSGKPIMLQHPEHYLDGGDCYPNLFLAVRPSAIITDTQLQAFSVNGLDKLTVLLPKLSSQLLEQQNLLHSINIGFDDMQHWYVTKGMINLGMADTCLASMQQVIDYGNKVDDYSIIKQTFIAEQLNFNFVFATDIEQQQLEALIAAVVSYYANYDVEVKNTSGEKLTSWRLKVNGPVAVGYISQPMSALMSR